MNKTTLLIILIFALFLQACRSKKQVQTPVDTPTETFAPSRPIARHQPANEIIMQAIQQRSNFEWFSANINGSGNFAGDRYSFGGQIRIKNNEAIWISITAFGLIEVIRLKATPDSVYLFTHSQLDRPENTTLHGFDFFKEMTGIDFTFDMLQDILVGNFFLADLHDQFSYNFFEGNFRFTDRRPFADVMYEFILSDANYKTLSLTMRDTQNRSVQINYEGHTLVNENLFPQNISIRMQEPMPFDMRWNYQRIQLNVPQNMPFNIPRALRRQ